uniref:Cuticle protein n=1 Tax=Daphnia magna TaxID=35525 RepID=A0A0P5JN20_9CRUS
MAKRAATLYYSNMKFFILAALFAIAAADSYKAAEYAPKYEAPKYEAPKYEEVTYAPQPYSFGYDVQDKESYNDFDHSEKSEANVVTGSYRVALPDGRTQIVTYKADSYGYTADVKYEGEARYPEYKETQQYKAPAYPAPAYKAPEYKAPAYVAPAYSAPAYKAPEYKAPAYTAPAPKATGYAVAPSYKSYAPAPAYKAPAAYPKY